MRPIRLLAAAASTAGLALSSTVALAHAVLKAAVPASGAVVAPAPAELRLTFNEPLEARFCTVKVTRVNDAAAASGASAAIAAVPVKAAADDAASLVVPMPAPAAAGAWQVEWSVMGRDGHRTRGRYAFTVTR